MIEKLLRLLLLIPRRLYDAFMRLRQQFQDGNWSQKIKMILIVTIGLIILIPLAAFGLVIFLILSAIGFVLSLIYGGRRGPPM